MFLQGLYGHDTEIENDSVFKKPKLFLDCDCFDTNYIRSEITFVHYVRDRRQADIVLLVTDQRNALRGREYTLTFTGLNLYSGMNDTLTYNTKGFDSEELQRTGFIRTMKRGLLNYIRLKDIKNYFDLNLIEDENQDNQNGDKWNNWVFRVRLSGNVHGEKQQQSHSYEGSIRADRITEDWKFRSYGGFDYDEDQYEYEDESFKSFNRRYRFRSTLVKSISNHFSLGGFCTTGASTYGNIKFEYGMDGAVEYSYFPYDDFTYRSLTFLYAIGVDKNNYRERTIYNKTDDLIFEQNIEVSLEINKEWGRIDARVNFNNHLNDFSRNKLESYTWISLNLFEGFSLDFGGGYSSIHNQISIPQRDLSLEELLLHRRELETQYSFWGSVGFSYTFGSIYNNAVNPRFGD
jgi:hypothetical protein